MHCAACVSKVKKALSAVDGVLQAEVDLSSKSAIIVGEAQPDDLIKAVKDTGYESFISKERQEKIETDTNDLTSQARQLFPYF